MKLKEYDKELLPRERLIKYGVESLSLNDILSIILRTGIKDLNVRDISTNILNEYTLKSFSELSYEELIKIPGIGSTKAITMLAIFEFSKRINSIDIRVGIKLNNSSVVHDSFKRFFYNKKQEIFMAIYLDTKKCLIKYTKLFIGTLDRSIVHPRDIIREAIKVSASSLIVMHNHPSGNVLPSNEDIMFTNNLKEICKLVSIPLVDHIITNGIDFYSFFVEYYK